MSKTQPEQQALASAQETLKEIEQGHLPSNEQITKGISEVQHAASENKSDLSRQGQKVLEDTNRLLETIKHLVDDKNKDEYVQKAFAEAYEATDKEDLAARRQKIKEIVMATVNSEQSKNEASEGVDNLMTVIRLMVSSPEFRSLINDLETIFEQAFVVDEKETRGVQANPTPSNTTFTATATIGENTANNFGATAYRFGQTPYAVNPSNDPFSAEAHFGDGNAQMNIGGITAGDATTSISQDEAADEAEETLIDHYAKIAHTLNNNPEYRNAINYLMDSVTQLSDYFEKKAEQLESVHEKESNKPDNQEADEHARKAWINGKHFLENWVGPNYSLDEFLDSIHDIAVKAKNDDELATYIKEVREFFEKSVADREYVQNEERVKEDARKRIRKGRQLANEKYRNEFQRLQKEFEYLNDGIQSDSGVQQLQSDFKQLVGDLFLDENGQATLHTELLRDLQIVVPNIVRQMRRLPLPEIDMSDDEMDLKIKNAVLDCADIAPSHFQFTLLADTEKSRVSNVVRVVISKIRARVLGADFYINKKTFPKVEDSGKADLAIYGKNGMTIAFELCPWDYEGNKDGAPALKLRRNVCSISKLNLRLRKTQHDILYSLLSPVINAMVKTRIENSIKQNVKEIIEEGSLQAKRGIEQGLQNAENAAENAINNVNTKPAERKVEEKLN